MVSTPDLTSAVETANSLVTKAIEAQDRIGYTDNDDLGGAVLNLARTVTALAREVKALALAVDWQQGVIDGQSMQLTTRSTL
ncbi:hypothetical protein ACFWU5_16870 [Nocardia sp. NPDC058640]|uniref:hypothetical protein n=1 Tax=Nocardia sp. NPDC058640 TaxID=3346571 RepID=UPI0036580771